MLTRWTDLIAEDDDEEQAYWIDPYIVDGGFTFLWGETSLGKTPLTFYMAKAIGDGSHFFGLPARKGKVLYIDADTPRRALKERLKGNPKYVKDRPILKPSENVWLLTTAPLTVPNVPERYLAPLREAQEEIVPDVVFANTLRKMHTLDDKDSSTPPRIMGFFREVFPQAAVVLIHHPRKSSTTPGAVEVDKESFSGSNAWINDSQVGLHLQSWKEKDRSSNRRLVHNKAQNSEELAPLYLNLSEDPTQGGMLLTSPSFDQMLHIYERLNEARHSGDFQATAFDAQVAAELKVSDSTVRRRRQLIEAGHFPNSRRWLTKKQGD